MSTDFDDVRFRAAMEASSGVLQQVSNLGFTWDHSQGNQGQSVDISSEDQAPKQKKKEEVVVLSDSDDDVPLSRRWARLKAAEKGPGEEHACKRQKLSEDSSEGRPIDLEEDSNVGKKGFKSEANPQTATAPGKTAEATSEPAPQKQRADKKKPAARKLDRLLSPKKTAAKVAPGLANKLRKEESNTNAASKGGGKMTGSPGKAKAKKATKASFHAASMEELSRQNPTLAAKLANALQRKQSEVTAAKSKVAAPGATQQAANAQAVTFAAATPKDVPKQNGQGAGARAQPPKAGSQRPNWEAAQKLLRKGNFFTKPTVNSRTTSAAAKTPADVPGRKPKRQKTTNTPRAASPVQNYTASFPAPKPENPSDKKPSAASAYAFEDTKPCISPDAAIDLEAPNKATAATKARHQAPHGAQHDQADKFAIPDDTQGEQEDETEPPEHPKDDIHEPLGDEAAVQEDDIDLHEDASDDRGLSDIDASAQPIAHNLPAADIDRSEAEKQEWESRRLVIEQQGLEARRLRKKKRAEAELLERAQARLQEHRDAQVARETALQDKEHLRSTIRDNLKLRVIGRTGLMEILLALGIQVEGSSSAMVTKAYRKALQHYHPDRHVKANLEQQLYAEEIFKIISQAASKRLA